MSKGSWKRPASVSDNVINENWQRIFGEPKALENENKSSDRYDQKR